MLEQYHNTTEMSALQKHFFLKFFQFQISIVHPIVFYKSCGVNAVFFLDLLLFDMILYMKCIFVQSK